MQSPPEPVEIAGLVSAEITGYPSNIAWEYFDYRSGSAGIATTMQTALHDLALHHEQSNPDCRLSVVIDPVLVRLLAVDAPVS